MHPGGPPYFSHDNAAPWTKIHRNTKQTNKQKKQCKQKPWFCDQMIKVLIIKTCNFHCNKTNVNCRDYISVIKATHFIFVSKLMISHFWLMRSYWWLIMLYYEGADYEILLWNCEQVCLVGLWQSQIFISRTRFSCLIQRFLTVSFSSAPLYNS